MVFIMSKCTYIGQRREEDEKKDQICKTLMPNITLVFIKSTHLGICRDKILLSLPHYVQVAHSNLQTTEAITVKIMQMVQQDT